MLKFVGIALFAIGFAGLAVVFVRRIRSALRKESTSAEVKQLDSLRDEPEGRVDASPVRLLKPTSLQARTPTARQAIAPAPEFEPARDDGTLMTAAIASVATAATLTALAADPAPSSCASDCGSTSSFDGGSCDTSGFSSCDASW